jgi:tRNA (guanine37-N1)-methyltransferase
LADILSLDEILQAILPEELCDGSPTGFSMTGHLGMLLYCTKFIFTLFYIAAHMNLNDKYLPYKYIIGQVVLDVRILEHVQTIF